MGMPGREILAQFASLLRLDDVPALAGSRSTQEAAGSEYKGLIIIA